MYCKYGHCTEISFITFQIFGTHSKHQTYKCALFSNTKKLFKFYLVSYIYYIVSTFQYYMKVNIKILKTNTYIIKEINIKACYNCIYNSPKQIEFDAVTL